MLRRLFSNGSTREVPRPAERAAIVAKSHGQAGHFGVKRTASSAATEYWWHGMHAQIKLHVRSCEVCARVRASFVPRDTNLHPLPIMGTFYRWSVDLAGPFEASKHNNLYVKGMVEHFSKWVEVAPLLCKES